MSILRPVPVAAVAAFSILLVACANPNERKTQYLERGKQYLAEKNYEKARVEFRNVIQLDPKDPEVRYLAGQTAERLNEPREAVSQYQASLGIDENNAQALAAMARVYALAGMPDKARELVDKGLGKHPDQANLLAARAAAHVAKREMKEAIEDAERAHGIDPAETTAIGILASLYSQNQQWLKAATLMEESIKRDPRNIEYYVVLADLQQRQQQFDAAEGTLKQAVGVEPANLDLRLRLARFYVGRKNVDAAEGLLREGIRQSPDNARPKLALLELLAANRPAEQVDKYVAELQAFGSTDDALRLQLGDHFVRRNQLDRATAEYQAVLKHAGTDPSGLSARNKLAALAIQRKDLPQANKLIAEVLAENNRDADALSLRGGLALTNGQYAAAITDLRAVLRDQPGSAQAARALARAHLSNGEAALAEETLRATLQASPSDQGLRFDLATLFGNAGQWDQARPLLEALARELPQDQGVLQALFTAQLNMKDRVAAGLTAEQIEHNAPQSALGPYLLGQVAASFGDADEAVEQYQRALKLQPGAIDPVIALVRIELARKRLDAASTRIDTALAASTDSAPLQAMRGLVRIEQGRLPEAVKALNEAQRLAPSWWEPYRSEAIAHLAAKDTTQAIDAYRRGIVQASASSAPLVAELAALLERNGKSDEAIQVYEDAVSRNARDQNAARNLALLLVNYRSSAADIQRAQQLVTGLADRSDEASLDVRGWVTLKAGKPLDALPLLERAAGGGNPEAVVHYHLALAQLQTGNKEAARRSLEQALQSGRNFAGSDDARRQLTQLQQAGKGQS